MCKRKMCIFSHFQVEIHLTTNAFLTQPKNDLKMKEKTFNLQEKHFLLSYIVFLFFSFSQNYMLQIPMWIFMSAMRLKCIKILFIVIKIPICTVYTYKHVHKCVLCTCSFTNTCISLVYHSIRVYKFRNEKPANKYAAFERVVWMWKINLRINLV